MKNYLIYFLFIAIGIFIISSCGKDIKSPSENSKVGNYERPNTPMTYIECNYDLVNYENEELVKVMFSQFIGESIRDVGFRSYMLSHLYKPDSNEILIGSDRIRKSSEFIIVEHLSDIVTLSNGTTERFGKLFLE